MDNSAQIAPGNGFAGNLQQVSDFSARYSRQLQLPGFGPVAQQKLAAARVLVIGAGGLGVPVLQYLAGMGIGRIGIVDDDVVSLSNLQRQVLYSTADIGRPKAEVAAARLSALNPDIRIHPYQTRLDPANALDIMAGYDVVVDATDNFAARYLINDACVILGKPFVYGAVQHFEGHVSVFNYEGGPTYRCLFPTPPGVDEIPDCDEAGVLGVVPGIIGCRQALEVVKLIAGVGMSLSGSLQVYDFLCDEQFHIRLKPNPERQQISRLQESYNGSVCSASTHFVQPAELNQWLKQDEICLLVDVREPAEFSAGHLAGAVNIPLDALPGSTLRDHRDGRVILYCQKGARSARAHAILRARLPQLPILELAGGFDNWIKAYGPL